MLPFFSVDRSNPPACRQNRSCPGGHLYRAAEAGLAWRVRRGVVRLDGLDRHGKPVFASLAVVGDIIGCETLLLGTYTFSATALTPCELTPWPEGETAPAGESLLASLAQAQRRAADIVALRGGLALERVLGLIRLLADATGQVVLPMRQDMADITDLRFETISRIIKQLERAQVLLPLRLEGVHATRGFQLSLPVLHN